MRNSRNVSNFLKKFEIKRLKQKKDKNFLSREIKTVYNIMVRKVQIHLACILVHSSEVR